MKPLVTPNPPGAVGSGHRPGGKLRECDEDLRRFAESAPSPEGAVDGIDARIAALLPAQLLQPSEIIILLIKPSPWYILLAPLGFFTGIIIFTAILLSLQSRGMLPWIARNDLILAAAGVCAVRLFWQFLEWLSRIYVLTDQRIIRLAGVIRVQIFEAQLKNIQHTQTVFSLRERFFHLGTIAFATSGTGGIEAAWVMVSQPLEVHRTVVETISRYGK